MPCARCGSDPETGLVRYAEFEGQEEIRDLLLCPSCSYGFNVMLAAYVANREETIPRP
jgi:hypothetical protein